MRTFFTVRRTNGSPLQANQCRGAARNSLNSGNPEVLSGLSMPSTPIRYRGHEEHGSG